MQTNPIDKDRPKRRHRASGGPVEQMRRDVKRRRAMEMALDYMPVSEIAAHFQASESTIYDWLHNEHDKDRYARSKMALQLRSRQDVTYERLLRKWLPLALTADINVVGTDRRGNPIQLQAWEAAKAASDQVLKALQQQAKLHGLDTVKVDVQSGGLPISEALIKAVRDFAQPKTIAAQVIQPILTNETEPAL